MTMQTFVLSDEEVREAIADYVFNKHFTMVPRKMVHALIRVDRDPLTHREQVALNCGLVVDRSNGWRHTATVVVNRATMTAPA